MINNLMYTMIYQRNHHLTWWRNHHSIINLVVSIEVEYTIVNIRILNDSHNTHKLGEILLRLIILPLAHRLLEEIITILIGIHLLAGMSNLPILLQGIEIDVLINILLYTILIVLYFYSSFSLFLVIKN